MSRESSLLEFSASFGLTMSRQRVDIQKIARCIHGEREVSFPPYLLTLRREQSFKVGLPWEMQRYSQILAEAGFFFLTGSSFACFLCGIVVNFPSEEKEEKRVQSLFEDPWNTNVVFFLEPAW